MRFFFILQLLTIVTAKVNDPTAKVNDLTAKVNDVTKVNVITKVNHLKSHFLDAAKRDMIPSLMWASRQVESLVPVWINVQVLKLNKGTVQTCLIEFGIIVLKELEPGLEKSCTVLLQKHPMNTRFTREEMADFLLMLNDEWSMALKRSLEIWVNRELDSLMGIFAKKYVLYLLIKGSPQLEWKFLASWGELLVLFDLIEHDLLIHKRIYL